MPVDNLIATYDEIVVVIADQVPPGFNYFVLDVPPEDYTDVGYFHLEVTSG